MVKVLFVCIGNINRSKAAEIIAINSGLDAKSCGVGPGRFNAMITKNMAAALESNGVAVDRQVQRSLAITQELYDWADVVVPMTRKLVERMATKIKMDSFKVNPTFCYIGKDIADPHFDSSGAEHLQIYPQLFSLVSRIKGNS